MPLCIGAIYFRIILLRKERLLIVFFVLFYHITVHKIHGSVRYDSGVMVRFGTGVIGYVAMLEIFLF